MRLELTATREETINQDLHARRIGRRAERLGTVTLILHAPAVILAEGMIRPVPAVLLK